MFSFVKVVLTIKDIRIKVDKWQYMVHCEVIEIEFESFLSANLK